MTSVHIPKRDYQTSDITNILFYVIAVSLVVFYLTYQPELLSISQMQDMGSSHEAKTTVYIFSFLIMLLCALTPVPAELIALANTIIYSPLEAFFVTWISAIINAQVGFEFGRLNKLDPCKYSDSNKICEWLTRYGYKALAIMRLIPIVPFFALNICGGIFKLNRCKYTVITAFTIIPAVAVLTFFPHLFL